MRDYTGIRIEDPDKVYFTADLHFFHEGIIGHCARPFKDVEEMNERLIDTWNSVVPRDGAVYVLGDAFYKSANVSQCMYVMGSLNGSKTLIAGNHDLFSWDAYLVMGFEIVRDYLELIHNWQRIVLCHYPILEWNGFYYGAWHLHGHVHGRGSHFSHRVMDVGVDVNDYRTVSWKQVVAALADGREKDKTDMEERGDTVRHRPYTFRRD